MTFITPTNISYAMCDKNRRLLYSGKNTKYCSRVEWNDILVCQKMDMSISSDKAAILCLSLNRPSVDENDDKDSVMMIITQHSIYAGVGEIVPLGQITEGQFDKTFSLACCLSFGLIGGEWSTQAAKCIRPSNTKE